MVVILANGYNHIIANGNIVLISNVVIAFVALVKFHATVNVIGSAALDLLVDRRIEYFTHSVETHKLPYGVGKIAPELWKSLLIVCSLDNTLWSFRKAHGDSVILCFKRVANHIIGVAFDLTEQVIGINVIKEPLNTALDIVFSGHYASTTDVLNMLQGFAFTIKHQPLGVIPGHIFGCFGDRLLWLNLGDSAIINGDTVNSVRLVIAVKYIEVIHFERLTHHIRQVNAVHLKVRNQRTTVLINLAIGVGDFHLPFANVGSENLDVLDAEILCDAVQHPGSGIFINFINLASGFFVSVKARAKVVCREPHAPIGVDGDMLFDLVIWFRRRAIADVIGNDAHLLRSAVESL